jgi:hypothetical protein
MSTHLAKNGFMSNYLLWHKHGEVWHAVANESNGNDDVDRMDDMVVNIGMGYDLEFEDPPPEVQNLCGNQMDDAEVRVGNRVPCM